MEGVAYEEVEGDSKKERIAVLFLARLSFIWNSFIMLYLPPDHADLFLIGRKCTDEHTKERGKGYGYSGQGDFHAEQRGDGYPEPQVFPLHQVGGGGAKAQ